MQSALWMNTMKYFEVRCPWAWPCWPVYICRCCTGWLIWGLCKFKCHQFKSESMSKRDMLTVTQPRRLSIFVLVSSCFVCTWWSAGLQSWSPSALGLVRCRRHQHGHSLYGNQRGAIRLCIWMHLNEFDSLNSNVSRGHNVSNWQLCGTPPLHFLHILQYFAMGWYLGCHGCQNPKFSLQIVCGATT